MSDNFEKKGIPTAWDALSAFPNPFNSSTTITFGLDKSAPTRLAIYDLSGRVVADLSGRFGNRPYAAGEHKVVWDAIDHPAGVYLVRLEAGGEVATRKVVLMR